MQKYTADFALIAGGSEVDLFSLQHWSEQTDADIFAADGGIIPVLNAGLTCRAVIGDMDSIPADIAQMYAEHTSFHAVSEQDTTDLEKLLQRLDCRKILGFGFMDGQFDHALSVLSILARYADTAHIVMVGARDCMLVTRKSVTLTTQPDCRFSLWPIGEMSGISSSGLKWPLDTLHLHPQGLVSTSNRTSAAEQTIHVPADNQTAYAIIMDKVWAAQMLDAERF